jgi:putative ABC transport system substrate-binding protein
MNRRRALLAAVGGVALAATPAMAQQPGRSYRIGVALLLELAAERRMATMMSDGDEVVAGGLVSYGTDPLEIARHGADHLVRVLRGAKPAELPVDQIARFHLVINLKTAKAIALDVPQSLLVRADRVIE